MLELATLLRAASSEALRSVNTGMPGEIVSYDPSTQTASVKLLLRMKQPNGESEIPPVLSGVPVVMPRAGGGALTFPVKAGDGVMVQFSQRSLDEWKEAGGEQSPDDVRMHDISDAVAVVGLADRAHGGSEEGCVHLFLGSSGLKIYPDRIEIDTPLLVLNGNFTVGGGSGGGSVNLTSDSLTHNGVDIGSTHKHSGVQSGGSNTGEPV